MRRTLVLGLVLLCSQMVGGFTYPLGSASSVVGGGSGAQPVWYCFNAADVSSANAQYASWLPAVDGVASWTTSDDFVTAFPPLPNGQWIVYGMSTFVTTTLGAAEDCLITLNSAAAGGADTDILAVAVGALGTLGNDVGGACEVSVLGADATNVDDVGDYCIQTLSTPTTVAVNNGLRYRLNTESAGTCTVLQSVEICALAQVVGAEPMN